MMISLMLCFIVLQIVDCLTTTHILKNNGKELNPMMNWMYQRLGIGLALTFTKGALIIAVVSIWSDVLTFWLCVLYAMSAGHNLYQIAKD
jgi:hypothetical protein